MPATPASTTLPARLRRAARLGAVALAAVAVALGPVVSAPVPATAAAATPTPSPTPQYAGLSITLVPDARGAYTPGAPLAATVSIRNDQAAALPAGRVRLELGRTPLADRGAVTEWLRSGTAGSDLAGVGETASVELASGANGSAGVVVTGPDIGPLAPGVYPLRATLVAAAAGAAPQSAIARSVIVISRGATPAVTVVVPITATPAGDLLTADELRVLTGADGALTAQLSGVVGTSAVLAIDPLVTASIRALGSAAPASATTWLNRLEALGNERFPLQPGDADTTAQANAGLAAPLDLTTLAPLLPPSASATPTPSPDASPATVADPGDLSSLGGIGPARSDILWPRGDVSAASVKSLGAFGPGGATTAPILPSTSFTTGVEGGSVPAHGVVGSTGVLVTDAAVSAALSEAAVEADPARRDADLATAAGMLWFADPGSTVLAGLDRADARPSDALNAAVTALTPGRTPGLAEILASGATALTVASTPDATRSDAVTALGQDEERLTSFATVLVDPAQLTVRERLSELRLLGVGVHEDPADFAAALAGHREKTRKTLDAVGIQPANQVLISANVDMPVWVRNDLPYPIAARLEAVPGDGRIEVQRLTDIEIPASSTTRVKIPAKALVSSGETSVTLSLASRPGVPIGHFETVRLTLRAEWETFGLIGLGVIAALFIGLGVIRTVLRRRASKAAPDEDVTTTDDEPDADGAPDDAASAAEKQETHE